ncbi:hypothetical protein JOM56_011014 [Amanita muscaria]
MPTHPAPGYDLTQQDYAPDASPTFCLEKDSTRTKLQPQGYYVPSLGPGEWKKAIEQWHHGDPAAGMAAMKDWPQSAFSGRRKKDLATIRQGRYLIAMAYEGCRSDDSTFLKMYPEAGQSISALLGAIRGRHNLQRCKNKSGGAHAPQQL